jgi:hypothetical protein
MLGRPKAGFESCAVPALAAPAPAYIAQPRPADFSADDIAGSRQSIERANRPARRRVSAPVGPFAVVAAIASLFGSAANADTATISQARWSAFVASTTIGKCDGAFIPAFGSDRQNVVVRKTVTLGAAAYKNFEYGADLEKPMKTRVTTHDPSWRMSTLTVERSGSIVSFFLENPGGSTRGFFVAADPPATIGLGSRTFAERLQQNVPATVLAAGDADGCGLTYIGIRAAGTPEDEGAKTLVLRGHSVAGFEETEAG